MVGVQAEVLIAMSPRKSRLWPAIALATLSALPSVHGKTSPLSVTPSEKWYGDIGNWSAVSINVGKPQQELDLMVSTASSEISVVASTACSTGKRYIWRVKLARLTQIDLSKR